MLLAQTTVFIYGLFTLVGGIIGFVKAKSKMEIIVTFMSILELIRLREILVMQKRVFGDIEVLRNRNNLVPDTKEKELEVIQDDGRKKTADS